LQKCIAFSLVLALGLLLGQATVARTQVFLSGHGGFSFSRGTDIRETSPTSIIVVENWLDELAQRVPVP